MQSLARTALAPTRRVGGGASLLQARGLAAAAAGAQRVLYRSTRGGQSNLTFSEAVLQGLGTDRGLLVPQRIPTFTPEELESWRGLPFDKLANKVCRRASVAARGRMVERRRRAESVRLCLPALWRSSARPSGGLRLCPSP
eukprot:scaffold2247_cov112-Isochrysis_galbana.AAC.4